MGIFKKLSDQQGKKVGMDGAQGGQHPSDRSVASLFEELATTEGKYAEDSRKIVLALLYMQSQQRRDTKNGKYDPRNTVDFQPERDD